MGLEISNISHRFGSTPAVDDASLVVANGEIVCLFGPSGCGKTTLLRVVAGLERLQAGAVSVDGAAMAGPGVDTPPEDRPVGFVFQDFVLFPHLTAAQNVGFGLRRLQRSRRLEAVREELKRVGLDGLGNRYPHELSGGQQQRVALARAFVRRPRAMLLDEPFASIDAVLRRRLRDDVRRLLKQHDSATILVTHDPEEALALGDRIAIMERGRIIELAAPQALFDAPQTAAGAAIFPGAQSLAGAAKKGTVVTAFGEVPGAAPGDGPVFVVVQPGGVAGVPDAAGRAIAVDCRFVGPHWLVELASADATARLRVAAPAPSEPGARFGVAFAPPRVKVFAAAEPTLDAAASAS